MVLRGLSIEPLNGKSCTIFSYNTETTRYGVRLSKSGELKSIKAGNLIPYDKSLTGIEVCNRCNEELFLHEFPPCACFCVPSCAIESSGHAPTKSSTTSAGTLDRKPAARVNIKSKNTNPKNDLSGQPIVWSPRSH